MYVFSRKKNKKICILSIVILIIHIIPFRRKKNLPLHDFYMAIYKKKERLIIHNQYPIVENDFCKNTFLIHFQSLQRDTPLFSLEHNTLYAHIASFLASHLRENLSHRRDYVASNAFFRPIPQPSFSRPLYFSTLHRLSSFHAILLPRGRTLEHPTLPSFLPPSPRPAPGPLSRPIQR